MAEGFDERAVEAGFHTDKAGEVCHLALTKFKVSNGQVAEIRSAYFETAEEANGYFDWVLKNERAKKVTERGDNISGDGKPVGKRAVISYEDGSVWEVLWTAGSTFRGFRAHTRAVVLELERQSKGRNMNHLLF
jgi:hypothetical protein